MSNYSQTTFFTPKDSLPLGNPSKIIYGAAYDVEFGNISTAIASKLDTGSTGESIGNLTVTGASLPTNGIYLPAANSVGIAANTTNVATFKTGLIIGAPTGGDQGAGTINATGFFINGVSVGFPVSVKTKASDTTRASTVTPSNDPDLAFAITATGTYLVQVIGSATSAANGMQGNINYSGTQTSSSMTLYLTDGGSIATNHNGLTVGSVTSFVQSTQGVVAGTQCGVLGEAIIVVTGAGTVAFAWSPTSNSANSTIMKAGSTMIVTKIA